VNEALQAHIDQLTLQLDQANERDRENRRIIAGLVQRVPEIESPGSSPEPRESPQTSSDKQSGGTASEEEGEAEKRSWWRRVFLGE
jgi:hypothetical protein